MKISVYGHQDSGKTTFVERTVSALVGKGYRVSSLKHTSKQVELDAEGKDTWRHRQAGSDPVVLHSEHGTVLFAKPAFGVEDAVRMVEETWSPDVIVVEGLKHGPYPKVALGDIEPTEGTVLVDPTADEFIAHVEDEVRFERALQSLPGLDCGKCGLSCEEMARAIAGGEKGAEDCVELAARDVVIVAGGNRLPVGAFVAEITESTIRGMLSSLKGYTPDGDVEIRLRGRKDETKDDGTDE